MSARLLIVEDDETVAKSMAAKLLEEGYAVDVAHDGEEGLGMILEGDYQLILTDVSMPVMSGIEMMTRAQAQKGQLKCVMVGGMAPSPMPAGMAHATVLQRPVSMPAVIAAVKAHLAG